MFVYNGRNTLCGVFILHLLRKARGCCMHVFSSFIIFSAFSHEKTWTIGDLGAGRRKGGSEKIEGLADFPI